MKLDKRLIRTPAEWKKAVTEMCRAERVAVDSEYEKSWPYTIPVGMSFSWRVDKTHAVACYVPLHHHEADDNGLWSRARGQMEPSQLKTGLQQLVDSGAMIVMHNAPADLKILHKIGVVTDEIKLFDTMIASWILETDRECGHGLKGLTKSFYGFEMNKLDQFVPLEYVEDRTKPPLKSGPRKGLYRVKKTGRMLVSRAPIKAMFEYAPEDAYYTLRLSYTFGPLIEQEGMTKVFYSLEMEVQQFITEMEEHGMVIDRPWLEAFREKLLVDVEEWKQKVFDLRPGDKQGVPFLTTSQKQLNEVFFDELGVEPRGQPGKSGHYSLNADSLKAYANIDGVEIAKILGEVNKRLKMISTINSWLEKAVRHPDGTWRLHGHFLLHGTRTGRLSSNEPNLQNVPTRDKRFPLRTAFLAPPGFLVGDADYAQIELKILAHFSNDERMVRAMNMGGDLHSETAKLAYHLTVPDGMSLKDEGKYVKQQFDTERGRSKNINFATVYGSGPNTLSIKYDIPLNEAKTLLERHPKIFPGAHRWIAKKKNDCTRDGFVRTILGRKRHLPDAKLDPRKFPFGSVAGKIAFTKRGGAERRAVNSPIQGSAADIIALAMRNIRRYFRSTGEWMATVIPAAQVHDELVFYIKASEAERVMDVIIQIMNKAVKLRVPTEAEGSFGRNWIEAKCEHKFTGKQGEPLPACPSCGKPNPDVPPPKRKSVLRKKAMV